MTHATQGKKSTEAKSASRSSSKARSKLACHDNCECEDCRKYRGALYRSALGAQVPNEIPSIVHEVLRSSGRPLEPSVRSLMEDRFQTDFSRVRVHSDARAAESARAVNARAYAVGNDIALGAGAGDPHSPGGRMVLAHELAHVVQSAGASTDGPLSVVHDGAIEAEAHSASQAIAADRRVSIRSSGSPLALRRYTEAEPDESCYQGTGLPAWRVGQLAHSTIQDELEKHGIFRDDPIPKVPKGGLGGKPDAVNVQDRAAVLAQANFRGAKRPDLISHGRYSDLANRGYQADPRKSRVPKQFFVELGEIKPISYLKDPAKFERATQQLTGYIQAWRAAFPEDDVTVFRRLPKVKDDNFLGGKRRLRAELVGRGIVIYRCVRPYEQRERLVLPVPAERQIGVRKDTENDSAAPRIVDIGQQEAAFVALRRLISECERAEQSERVKLIGTFVKQHPWVTTIVAALAVTTIVTGAWLLGLIGTTAAATAGTVITIEGATAATGATAAAAAIALAVLQAMGIDNTPTETT